MGEELERVKLYGALVSPHCRRVEIALKLKGIPYDYVEEDLFNKSQALLQHNKVHRQVPVMVHRSQPMSESLVILEYIDECWPHLKPRLLPDDPYLRAKVRFWANFYDQKVLSKGYPIVMAKGQEREKAIKDYADELKAFEEGIERDFPKDEQRGPFFNGDTLGYLDILVASNGCVHEAFNDAISTITIDPHQHPMFMFWVNALRDHAAVKASLPDHDKLVAVLRQRFAKFL